MKRGVFLGVVATGLASACASVPTVPLSPTPNVTPTAAAELVASDTPLPPTATTTLSVDCIATLPAQPWACVTGRLSPSDTPTPDPSILKDKTSSYRDLTYPFAFDYPAAYDLPDYSFCAPHPLGGASSYEVDMGGRTTVNVAPTGAVSLEAFVDNTIREQVSHGPWAVTRRIAVSLGVGKAIPGVLVEYRFGFGNRFGTATFAFHGDFAYIFNFTAGATCDIPDAAAYEIDAYQRMLQTFRFTD